MFIKSLNEIIQNALYCWFKSLISDMSVLHVHVYGKFICIQSSLSEPPSVCLFSGGAAGAVSRITGTIGKGLAALTFDDDYQKKRREGLNKKPANIGEGFARGGKGLVMVCVLLSVRLSLYPPVSVCQTL